MLRHRSSIGLLALLIASDLSVAGTFNQNFDTFANNAPTAGTVANTTYNLNGSNNSNGQVIASRKETNNTGTPIVSVVKTGVGSPASNALRLAEKGTASCVGAYILPVLDASPAVVGEFTITLDLLLDKTAGATPADGFNISFGNGLSGTGGSGGHLQAYGLIVSFDTYQNSTADPRSIEIFSDGLSVGNFLATGLPGGNFTYDQTWRRVELHWDAINGLDLTYAGQVIFTDLPTPDFIPIAGCNFAFNSATGGLNQDTFIDNLSISTVASTPPPPLVTGGVIIEEIMADNANSKEDEDLDHPDWIDLYNGSSSAVNLNGWTLTYTPEPLAPPATSAAPASYLLPNITIPAYGHQLLFASGKNKFTNVRPHTNFTLQKEGATLSLVKPDTTVTSTLSYPAGQTEDVSYGAKGTSQTLGFFDVATPGIDNSGIQAPNGRCPAPIFFKGGSAPEEPLPSSVLTSATSLGIRVPDGAPAGAEIRYTTNTGEPKTVLNTIYSAPLAITTGTAIKAATFAPGYLPSKTGNRSFIWLSSAADTQDNASPPIVTLNNIATNYNGSGQAFSSNLPIIVLDSYTRAVDSFTDPLKARPYRFTQAAVYDLDPTTGRASLSAAPVQMLRGGTHVRGQSSSGQAQRPYGWEFWKEDEDTDRNEPLLGMPSHSDWVLMTLTLDKSLMRNYIMQQAMLEANGAGAGVRCRFVEVFFNQANSTVEYGNDYRGVYLLMERISRSRERSNLAKINDSMSELALINGGYILKNDKTPYDSPFTPASVGQIPGSSRTWDIFDPEPPTTTQTNFIKSWFDQMHVALAASDFNSPSSSNYYGKWLDEPSMIDKTLWYELCKEVDAYTFSYYFSKDRNGKLMGYPFWDVDRSLGNSNYGSSNASFGLKWWTVGSNYTYFTRLDDDAEFNDRYWNRWTALRRSIFSTEALFAKIEATYSLLTDGKTDTVGSPTSTATALALQSPVSRHYRKYRNLGSNTFSGGQTGQAQRTNYRQEVDAMKTWIAERLEYLDGAPQTVNTTTLSERLKPTLIVDVSSGSQRYGGNVPSGHQISLENPNPAAGAVYYTIDGPDPRETGGGLNPSATTVTTKTTTASTIMTAGQTWKWTLPTTAAPANDSTGKSWTAEGYDDSAWGNGAAPLGWNETSLATNIAASVIPAYASTSGNANEPIPAYFRCTFNTTDTTGLTNALFNIIADDGAVIYLNGVEVARFNYPYPPSTASFTQEALGPIDPGNNFVPIETTFFKAPFDKTKLKTGLNTLAVEVHQATYSFPPSGATATSMSDMRFDLSITGLTTSGTGDAITFSTPGSHVIRTRIYDGAKWSPLTEAVFIVQAEKASAANLVVSEFHYHPADPDASELASGFNSGNDFEFIELMNISPTQAIDLTGVKIQDAVAFDFTTASSQSRYLAPGSRVVVVENPLAFAGRLRSGDAPIIAGTFSGNLSNNGEKITILAANGSVIKQFTYTDSFPWPKAADGDGFTIVLDSPFTNPDHNLGRNWRPSAEENGRPGNEDFSLFNPTQSWDGDDDGDGYSNGVEYALSSGSNDPFLPQTTHEPYSPDGIAPPVDYLYFRFQRSLTATGVRYQPQTSPNLEVWDDTDIVHVRTTHNNDGTATLTYRSTQPAAALPQRYFMRLRLSQQ